jgi:hypothetical protein
MRWGDSSSLIHSSVGLDASCGAASVVNPSTQAAIKTVR